MSFIFYIL